MKVEKISAANLPKLQPIYFHTVKQNTSAEKKTTPNYLPKPLLNQTNFIGDGLVWFGLAWFPINNKHNIVQITI